MKLSVVSFKHGDIVNAIVHVAYNESQILVAVSLGCVSAGK